MAASQPADHGHVQRMHSPPPRHIVGLKQRHVPQRPHALRALPCQVGMLGGGRHLHASMLRVLCETWLLSHAADGVQPAFGDGISRAGIQGTGEWLSNEASRPGSSWQKAWSWNSVSTRDLIDGPHLHVLSDPWCPLVLNSSTAQGHLQRPAQSKHAMHPWACWCLWYCGTTALLALHLLIICITINCKSTGTYQQL